MSWKWSLSTIKNEFPSWEIYASINIYKTFIRYQNCFLIKYILFVDLRNITFLYQFMIFIFTSFLLMLLLSFIYLIFPKWILLQFLLRRYSHDMITFCLYRYNSLLSKYLQHPRKKKKNLENSRQKKRDFSSNEL